MSSERQEARTEAGSELEYYRLAYEKEKEKNT